MYRTVILIAAFVIILSPQAFCGMKCKPNGPCNVVVSPARLCELPVAPARMYPIVVAPHRICQLPVPPERYCTRWIQEPCPNPGKRASRPLSHKPYAGR
jgi:hypothetical protein